MPSSFCLPKIPVYWGRDTTGPLNTTKLSGLVMCPNTACFPIWSESRITRDGYLLLLMFEASWWCRTEQGSFTGSEDHSDTTELHYLWVVVRMWTLGQLAKYFRVSPSSEAWLSAGISSFCSWVYLPHQVPVYWHCCIPLGLTWEDWWLISWSSFSCWFRPVLEEELEQ